MTAAALLESNPDPGENEIKYALKDTLCRCAGYPSILGAIRAAAKALHTANLVEPPRIPEAAHPHKAVGRIYPRPDAIEKSPGPLLTDDLTFEGMLHARVKRAMQPAAVVQK